MSGYPNQPSSPFQAVLPGGYSSPRKSENTYPPPPHASYPPTPSKSGSSTPSHSTYPSSPSPFAAVVPSPAVFPPGTDQNAVACFHAADQNGEGLIDDIELQKGLSLYHHTFSIGTVRLLMFVYTNFSITKIGPTEFVALYDSLKTWKAIFEKFDSDGSGKIEVAELGNALQSLGFAVPPPVLEQLVLKYGCGSDINQGIQYDNFIECCLIVKGLSEKFMEKDTSMSGSITLTIEAFLLTILPFITVAEPFDPSPATSLPPQKTAPQHTYPSHPSTPTYPPTPQRQTSIPNSSLYPYSPSTPQSPFAAIVPSPAVFPPGTDANAVACFQLADQSGEGLIDDFELQKGLSLYHHTFSIRTVRLLMYVHSNFSTNPKIGPSEFVTLYNSLKTWKVIFEKYDSDHSGKIDIAELGNAIVELGFIVPALVLKLLIEKYGCGSETDKAIEYDNFIECCLIVKGLSDKFQEKDTTLSGSITLTIESFLLTILPFIPMEQPTDLPPSSYQPPPTAPQKSYPAPLQKQSSYPPSYPPSPKPSYPPQPQSSYPPLPTPYYPPKTKSSYAPLSIPHRPPVFSSSPFAAVVPSQVVFPPGTDVNAVACFKVADQNGEGLIDDIELQKGLSLYQHTFNIHTVRLLMFVYTNFSTTTKIGPTEFVTLYNALKSWKAIFEKFDSDHSGKIEVTELGGALGSLGFAVPAHALELLVAKYAWGDKGIEYDNFIECCLIVKGLSDKFKEKDTAVCGSVTLTIEAFLLTVLSFIFPEEPIDCTPSCPVGPVVFPPGTDANAVACFHLADQNCEGLIDDFELQKGLSLYHHTFNIHTVRFLMFVHTNFSTTTKIGPTEFVALYNALKSWKAIFEKFDSDRSGEIEITELGGALGNLGFAVPAHVLELLVAKYAYGDKGIQYDNFIECCLIVKGLSDKFKEKDTALCGSVTLTIEAFLLTILSFIFPEEPIDFTPSCPVGPVVFPPGTDANAVACFHLADQNCEGLIDDFELQKGLSLYHHTFNIHTVRLLMFVHTNFSTTTKIGPTEFVALYNALKSWKAIFEKFDSDHSGEIEITELGGALGSLGFAVPAHVLELLVAKYAYGDKGIQYDNFIECCLIVKGLSDKFKEKDTAVCGSVTLTIEAFLLTILSFIFPEEPIDSTPLCPVVFPPGTDANAVACFHLADQNCEGLIDDFELQKGLSLYHHTFSIHTIRFLMFVHTNFSTTTKIGPTEFVALYNALKSWKAIFEKFDSDHSGKIEITELGGALGNLGLAVPARVLELLVAKYSYGGKAVEYDNFIECCLIVKGLSDKFKEKDTAVCGSVTLTIEAFLLTILPFIFPAEPTDVSSSCYQPPKTAPQDYCPPLPQPHSQYPSNYPPTPKQHSPYPPPSSTPPYPPPIKIVKTTSISSAYSFSASPFAAVVPSPVVFPPGTDVNAVACFQVADQNGEGIIDDFELQKGLSLYHHTFNIHTVRLLMFVYTNFSTVTKIGPTEFVALYDNLKTWKVAFEKFDSDHSGKIEVGELGNAFISLGFAVPPQVLELLVAKYGCETTGIEYDNFIECCLIVKGLSEKFKDKDTTLCGSITLTIEAFLLTILPFIFPAEPTDPPPDSFQPQKTPLPQAQNPCPPPIKIVKTTSISSAYSPSPSPFAAVVPSPVVFPPGTDANAVACFQVGDQNGEGIIDDFELQKGLSLYHHTFNIHTVRLLMFVYTNFSTVTKIGPTEFVALYDNLKTWKVAFEKFDSDHSGKIEVGELGNAFISLGFAVPPPVLELLVAKYGCETTGIEYDNFIECCLIVKGLSEKFKDKDTTLCGSITLTIEAFLLTILPFIFPAEPTDPPPKTPPPQAQPPCPPSTQVVFPPDTDSTAVACFQAADQSGEGLIDVVELQKGLSLYHQTLSVYTVRLLIFVYTDFAPVTKIGPTEFVSMYDSLMTWKENFEKFDSDRSGKIDKNELGNAMVSLGFNVPPPVLELLIEKFGCGSGNDKGIEYDNFIECCLIARGLSAKFQEKDTKGDGTSVTFGYESFLLTILPFATV